MAPREADLGVAKGPARWFGRSLQRQEGAEPTDRIGTKLSGKGTSPYPLSTQSLATAHRL
jgi:hypothetical protein